MSLWLLSELKDNSLLNVDAIVLMHAHTLLADRR